MFIKIFQTGNLQTNTYVITDRHGDNWVIDPGDGINNVIKYIKDNKLKINGMLLTHAHIDHINGAGDLAEAIENTKLFIHDSEKELYNSEDNNLPPYVIRKDNLPVPHDLSEAKLPCKVLKTPGHSPGGVCFYFKKEGILFSGDTLLAGSVGRTDIQGGDLGTIMKSIKMELLKLPDSTKVYPGHGDITSIGNERNNNPYLSLN